MLSRLLIKNYALIDNLDISFGNELNMITGETGAGKSILMGALGLILGNRAEGKQFFDESKKCVIEGQFNIEPYQLVDFFAESDLDYDHETIIRRELSVDGKSRAFINDSPVTLATLKLLGERLIDIHSQHATLQVNTEDFQLFVLDSLASNAEDLALFRKELRVWRTLEKELRRLREEAEQANAEQDYNQFLFDELEKVNPQMDEVKSLEEEQQQLEHAEEIKKSLLASTYLLSEGDPNVQNLLQEAIQQIQSSARYFNEVEELANRLQSAYIEIKDISQEIGRLEGGVMLDESRLDVVNNRLSSLYTLLKKHRVDSEGELIVLKDELEEKLQIVLHQEEMLEKAELACRQQLEKVLALADTIHNNRQLAIPKVERSVQDTLSSVGMPHAQLKIELQKMDVQKINLRGLDSVQFLFSANKGQTLQPIHKVASGGELSRVMLAIKSLVAQSSALPTIIFDEIDAGISGEVALRVGEVMRKLAKHMQVIAISHLPQIASKGSTHFKVYKEDGEDKTRSNIQLLDKEERVLEIAQMLSGTNPGETALQHARELLR